jgi:hypothetical protein
VPPRIRLAAPAIVALTLLSACGGSSNGTGSTAADTSPSGAQAALPATAAPTSGDAESATTPRQARRSSNAEKKAVAAAPTRPTAKHAGSGPDPVTRSHRPARGIRSKGDSESEVRHTGPLGVDPCSLVKRSEAQSIVGGSMAKPQLGLQGPTCIYQGQRFKQPITVALQQLSLPTVTRLGRHVVHTDVAGRKAVCLDYGGLKLLVPVSTGSVLMVGAPCPIAQHLAATALRRLR